MLGLHLSDLDTILYRHTVGDDEGYCVSPMSVIIMSVEICCRTGFGHLRQNLVDGVEAVRRGQLDVSEAKSLCSCTRVKDNDS